MVPTFCLKVTSLGVILANNPVLLVSPIILPYSGCIFYKSSYPKKLHTLSTNQSPSYTAKI